MSVIVKGMEMPDNCRECPFEMYHMNCGETRCRETGKILADFFKPIPFDGRAEECPLIEVPSADVAEVKHGRWIEYPECLRYENAYSDDHIVCSECKEVFSILDNDTERFDFCPHCGADMRGGI